MRSSASARCRPVETVEFRPPRRFFAILRGPIDLRRCESQRARTREADFAQLSRASVSPLLVRRRFFVGRPSSPSANLFSLPTTDIAGPGSLCDNPAIMQIRYSKTAIMQIRWIILLCVALVVFAFGSWSTGPLPPRTEKAHIGSKCSMKRHVDVVKLQTSTERVAPSTPMRLDTHAADHMARVMALIPKLSTKATPDSLQLQKLMKDAIDTLTPLIVAAPRHNNASCVVSNNPPQPFSCIEHPTVFAAEKRQVPNKLALVIQFGYDIDSLEIALHQYWGLVDKVFLLESTCNHQGIQKPLLWEMIKRSERFASFLNVVHLLQDDVNCQAEKRPDVTKLDWGMENSQERHRWAQFLEWNKASRFFSDSDLVGFGDVDQVASRENLLLLKHCSLIVPKVDIGTWFPFGRMTTAFKSDWPVSPHLPYAHGDPTFYVLSAAVQAELPNRQRGQSGSYLLGGMHLSFYGYLPQRILQVLSCTECVGQEIPQTSSVLELEREMARIPSHIQARLIPVESLYANSTQVVSIPWFLNCNRDRFPMWTEGGHDSRIDTNI